jgi:DNA-binding MarR family transcriptional regulator
MDIINNGLHEKFIRLQWLLHKQHLRGFANNGPMADPTRGQGKILALLKTQDGISTKDMSYLLDIRISSLNELLSKLEKNAYIIREPSNEDKRIILVKLTEKGKNEKQQKSFFGNIFNCLSKEEQNLLGKYLDKIIDSLAAEVGDEDDDERIEMIRAMHERMGDGKFMRLAHLIKHRGNWFCKRMFTKFGQDEFSCNFDKRRSGNKNEDND